MSLYYGLESDVTRIKNVLTIVLALIVAIVGFLLIGAGSAFAYGEYIDQQAYNVNIARTYMAQTFTSGTGWRVGTIGIGHSDDAPTVTVYICEGLITDATAATFGEACILDHLASVDITPVLGMAYADLSTPVALTDNNSYTLFMKGVANSQRFNVGSVYSGGRLVACNANNSECIADGRDLTFALGPSPLEVTIYNPSNGETVAQDEINAFGSEAFYFGVTTNLNVAENTGENGDYELNIYDSTPVLFCTMTVENSLNAPDGTNYGALMNHKVDGDPDPCPNFEIGDYTASATAEFDGLALSAISATTAFSVGTYSSDAPIDCPDDPSIFSSCWLQNILTFVFQPSENRVDALFAMLGELSGKWPISWFTDGFDALADSLDQTAVDYGEPDAGNFFIGDYPNIAWYIEKLRSFYGSWAEGAVALFIWLGAFLSISRSGLRLLNVETDDGLELG